MKNQLKNTNQLFRLTFLVLFQSFYTLGTSQTNPTSVQFAHIGLAEGLSQTSVRCMLQDYQDFLWIGTQDGLNRYDGYEFTVFRHDSDNPYSSIAKNNILRLYEDKQNRLWVSSEHALQYLNGETGEFIHLKDDLTFDESIRASNIQYVYQDQEGILWLKGNQLFAVNYPFTSEPISDFSTFSTKFAYSFYED